MIAWSLRPGPGLVHVHTATRGSWYRKSICVLLARLLRRPVVLHVHAGQGDVAAFCDRTGPLRLRALGAAFRRADRVLSVSTATALEMERRLGIREIVTLPNAAPVEADVPRAGGGLPNGDGPVRALYLGGFANPSKGGRVLVEALPALRDCAPPLQVTMAGLGEAPALDAEDERVRWLGWLEGDGAAAAIEASDIVVIPSISEGLPLALLEALARGKAVVASSVGGIAEIVTDGVDGVLVAPGAPDELARALGGLAADPDRRARIARAGAERAGRLAPREIHGRLDAIYRELLG
jgi:glycosyltransferase involved in cell wall biosynthesis